MCSDIFLRLLLFLDPTIGLEYGMVTHHSYAFSKQADVGFCNAVCNQAVCDQLDVQGIKNYFGAIDFAWVINGNDQQSAEILQQSGLYVVGSLPAMMYDLSNFSYKEIVGVQTIDLLDENAKHDFIHVVSTTFSRSAQDYYNLFSYLQTFLYDPSALHVYLIYQEKIPVAVGMMLVHKNVATIHSIAVLPEYRGKGYSKLIVEKAMFDAQQKGSELALLLASSMGKPVYEKLGFKEYAMYSIYELPGNRKKNKQHIFYM